MQNSIIQVSGVSKKFRTYVNRTSGSFFSKLFRKYYYNHALDNVSFSINEGQIVALLGRNGSGKSTLVKILTGIIFPDEGKVSVLGLDPWKERAKLAMNMGVVLGAHSQLYWNLPAIETFKFMRSMYRIPESDFNKRLNYLVDALNLRNVFRRQVRQLSLGEQMKCNFVASVLHNPKIVFLDEPTIGVDLPSKIALRETILDIRRRHKTTFLLTTHIVEDITIAENIILLDKGHVVFEDTRRKLESMFGNKRQIELSLSNSGLPSTNRYGKTLNRDKDYIKLEIDQSTLKKKSFIKLLANKNVLDYTVSEPGLNYILTKIYAGLDKRGKKLRGRHYAE